MNIPAIPSPLIDAIKRSDEPLVRALIAQGAPVNEPDADGVFPLCHATLLKTDAIALVLLQHGAEINHVLPNHYTVLTWAIRKKPSKVEWLLQHGARPDVLDGLQCSPLLTATLRSTTDIAQRLLNHQADVNQVTPSLHTALTYAIQNNRKAMVEWLLQHKANPEVLNGDQLSPLWYAIQAQNLELARLLMRNQTLATQTIAGGFTLVTHSLCSGLPGIVHHLLQLGISFESKDDNDILPEELMEDCERELILHHTPNALHSRHPYDHLEKTQQWSELFQAVQTDLQRIQLQEQLLQEKLPQGSARYREIRFSFIKLYVYRKRLCSCLEVLSQHNQPLHKKCVSEIAYIDVLVQYVWNTLLQCNGQIAFTLIRLFTRPHYTKGLEGLESPKPIPEKSTPIQQSIDQLWSSLEFHVPDMLARIDRGKMATSPEAARMELKRRLDSFYSKICTKTLLGAKTTDEVYNTIQRNLYHILEKLRKDKNNDRTVQVFQELIEAEGFCSARYLEVTQNQYMTLCCGVENTPENLFFRLCAQMRGLIIQEIVSARFNGNVHIHNRVKKDLGAKCGIPGFRSVQQEDPFTAEITASQYDEQTVLKDFLARYTPDALLMHFLPTRLATDSEALLNYFRLYEQLFPLTLEQLPLQRDWARLQQVPATQKDASLRIFLKHYALAYEPNVDQAAQDTYDRVFRTLGSWTQQRRTQALEQPEHIAKLDREIQQRLHTEKPAETLLQLYTDMKSIQSLQGSPKTVGQQKIASAHPDLFHIQLQSLEKVVQEAIEDEHQHVLHTLLMKQNAGMDTPKLAPLLRVLQKIGILDPYVTQPDLPDGLGHLYACSANAPLNADKAQLLLDHINQVVPGRHSELTFAIQNNNTAMVKWLLQSGARHDIPDGLGQLPIVAAMDLPTTDIAQLLLDHKVNVNQIVPDANTALIRAIQINNKDMVEWLLRHGARVDVPNGLGALPIYLATALSTTDIAQLLFDHKVDVNQVVPGKHTALTMAIQTNNTAMVKWLLLRGARVDMPNGTGMFPMVSAMALPTTDIAQLLLGHKVDVNQVAPGQRTALTAAIQNNNTAMVKWLLQSGAQVDVPDGTGMFPICQASVLPTTDIAQLLLGHKVDVNQVAPEQPTALTTAIQNNNTAMVKWLLQSGARADVPDGRGRLPIYLATALSTTDIAQLLFDHKVDINQVAPGQHTALTAAILNNNTAMAHWLLQQKADPKVLNGFQVSPLWYALTDSDLELARLLMLNKTLVTQKMAGGYTVVTYGLCSYIPGLVEHLLQLGISFENKDDNDILPGELMEDCERELILHHTPNAPHALLHPYDRLVKAQQWSKLFQALQTDLRRIQQQKRLLKEHLQRAHSSPKDMLVYREIRFCFIRFYVYRKRLCRFLGELSQRNKPLHKACISEIASINALVQHAWNILLHLNEQATLTYLLLFTRSHYTKGLESLESLPAKSEPHCEREKTPETFFFQLCAQMRSLLIQQIVNARFQGNILIHNQIKKDLGARCGIPGFRSAQQTDPLMSEITAGQYHKQKVFYDFFTRYTPYDLLRNFLPTRLATNDEALLNYFRLYEQLFPLTQEQLPLQRDWETLQQSPEAQRSALLQAFLQRYALAYKPKVEQAEQERYERICRALSSWAQQKRTQALEQPEHISELDQEIQLRLHTEKSVEALLQQQSLEEVVQEVIKNEHQHVLHALLMERKEGMDVPKLAPLILVLQKIGILDQFTAFSLHEKEMRI